MKDADSSPAQVPDDGDSPEEFTAASTRLNDRRFLPLFWFLLITAITIAIDQITKFWAEAELTGSGRIPLIGDLLGLRLVYNPGAAFSFGTGATWILTLLATAVAVVIIRIAPRVTSVAWMWALSLLLGGAIGNLIDRFFKAPGFPSGHVVDFIDYGIFIGNVADIAIVVAAGLMIILGARGVEIAAAPQGEVSDSDR